MRVSLPEQIWIDYEPATFASRSLAFVLDACWQGLWSILGILFLAFLSPLIGLLGDAMELPLGWIGLQGRAGSLDTALIILWVFCVHIIYPLFYEVRRHGVTPGKRTLRLRVVDERGLPLSITASLLRNIFKLVDLLPGCGLIGLISMSASRRNQRLGDMIAGTLVVHEKEEEEHHFSDSSPADAQVLPAELYGVLERYVQRMDGLTKDARRAMADRVMSAIEAAGIGGPLPQSPTPQQKEVYLRRLLKRSRPARVDGSNAMRAEAPADWSAFERRVQSVDESLQELNSSRKNLSASALFAIAEKYQSLCQLYAYLLTFYPETGLARRASRLVRSGRALIYGNRLGRASAGNDILEASLISSFRQMLPHVLLTAVLLFGSAALAFLLLRLNPLLAWTLISETEAARLQNGVLWTDSLHGASAGASAGIMTNNIQVTLFAYALGITFGVGTILLVIFNGGQIGALFEVVGRYGMAGRLAEFIAAHGVLELSIIIVSGGCGLFLADALIRPGRLSRGAAVRKAAKTTLIVMIFNAGGLILAGVIEGFISPYPALGLGAKTLLGTLVGAGYWMILSGARHRLPAFITPRGASGSRIPRRA